MSEMGIDEKNKSSPNLCTTTLVESNDNEDTLIDESDTSSMCPYAFMLQVYALTLQVYALLRSSLTRKLNHLILITKAGSQRTHITVAMNNKHVDYHPQRYQSTKDDDYVPSLPPLKTITSFEIKSKYNFKNPSADKNTFEKTKDVYNTLSILCQSTH
ncbi:hypothetical protein BDA99DRAFT_555781 [Phascolomyces articulosus]|uniref:Uncharacterized protein n=1 Tax=Phascolomyces articulosus TaxID=60185 RepID=A0AAD5KKI5_9FUNG|nr:hypothetical protein BDA99DRAFT_555781 [Phascolomyces articulosus]